VLLALALAPLGACSSHGASADGGAPPDAPVADAPVDVACAHGAANGGCLIVLASHLSSPSGLALDDTGVYWTQSDATASSVMRVPKGGGQEKTIVSNGSRPVAIGGANVYLDSGDGVMAVRFGDARTAVPFQGLGRTIAADAANVYIAGCANLGVLRVAPVAGGAAKTPYVHGCPQSIALGATSAYWTSQGGSPSDSSYTTPGIESVALGGASVAVSVLGVENMLTTPGGFAGNFGGGGGGGAGGAAGGSADAGASSDGAAGGSGADAASATDDAAPALAYGVSRPFGIAVDDKSVYWTDLGPPGAMSPSGSIVKMPIAGGQPTVIVSGLDTPSDLAFDGTTFYFTTANGAIMKAPLTGAAPVMLASAQSLPQDIKVDGTSVYWVNAGVAASDGAVMQLTPK
jgi:hypothetical protein